MSKKVFRQVFKSILFSEFSVDDNDIILNICVIDKKNVDITKFIIMHYSIDKYQKFHSDHAGWYVTCRQF